ncbi:30S ribosomal protein S3 [candidate division WOR-1 bacterium RIFOXYD2_FULL_36_8]|uniref:Small ribosomal subunit protein uS3 n=1 Tax=candidate division WOR-1 bacterium RIFOXYB2_FULL_36_35 TaxID=1802578 RepID=A0A1F4S514_UNCSA|nr:MAG: 30S ribosomal protein S3 [candidate division WOR-1 bacterium RIFOXYA2_FULL_36_21]OGC15526.1 MAG: 30S ribosomal protein S3 [candidate division WOR-1 bacterium RIFOXYB2_FULL_36_35]OGC21311.1 MAG: 30S ribosomal protein S3 [candidate division WOR-1 bacterium RIFOXYA12_FULL_36_13]OGC38392.1 MAG: 30S ribosomal protein S3 [candidate division WOR-1 bacterium RIFOXYD2_FULL_36_8]
MGQKTHPKGFRLGVIEEWDSIWYANKADYAKLFTEDRVIRKFLKNHLYKAGISKIKISRRANQVGIDVYSAKPGLIIGRGGKGVSLIRDEVVKLIGKPVQLNIHEDPNPETSSQLVSENIAAQLEKRVAYRRAMKQAVTRVLRAKAKGIKVKLGGRLGGSEIARKEWYRVGRVPLHTLRARIDYGFCEAMTIYGKIGVKVWIYKGDVLPQKKEVKEELKANDVTAREN